MTETGDFLFATTDVAIWSTVEPGVGIVAAAIACLRPLFRDFFGRSKFSNVSSTGGWGSSKAGYLRSQHNGPEELGLRNDLGKNGGVTTVIKTETKGHGMNRMGSQSQLKGGSGWEASDAGWYTGDDDVKVPHDDAADDFHAPQQPRLWGLEGGGITMTTEVTSDALTPRVSRSE